MLEFLSKIFGILMGFLFGSCDPISTPEPPPTPPIPVPPTYKICSQTGREATRWCRNYYESLTRPALACRFHLPPQHVTPRFILFNEALFSRPDFTEDNIMNTCTLLGQAGLHYFRTFIGWPWDHTRIAPFRRNSSGAYDLYCLNDEWVQLVQIWQRCAAQCGIGFIVDFFGQQVCRPTYPWAFFAPGHNIQGIESCYETNPGALDCYKQILRAVMVDTIGRQGNLVHFGNEQDVGNSQVENWARRWAGILGGFLRNELMIDMPIFCAGEPHFGTGTAISDILTQECGWPYADIISDLHGLTTWRAFEEWYKPHESIRWNPNKWYSASDDGASFTLINTPTEEERGICCTKADGAIRCGCNQFWRIEMIKKLGQYLKLYSVEWMPQEWKGPGTTWHLGDLHQEHSIDVYWKCAEQLWNIDIRREL